MKHVFLILKLRWMLFKNSLRSKSGCTELISAILLGLLLVPLDLVLSAGLGAIVYTLSGKPLLVPAVSCILAGVTLMWQLIPLLTASLGNDADIEKFRQYPLSTRELFAIDLALGTFDPVSLLAFPAIVAVLAGCAIRAPAVLPVGVISMGLFTAFNIILSRYIHRLISALFSNRKRREIIAVLIFLLVLVPQFIISMSSRSRARSIADHNASPTETVDATRKAVATAGEYLAWLPPGLAARNLGTTPDSTGITAWLALLAAAGFTFGVGWLEYARLTRDYYGRLPSPGRRSARKQQARTTITVGRRSGGDFNDAPAATGPKVAAAGFSRFSLLDDLFPWLPPASTAVLEKEIKYFYRSPRAFLIFIGPLLGTVIFIMPSSLGGLTARAENYRLAIVVLYSVLLDTQFFSNAFGFDWHGAKLYFMAPITGKSVLIGKNLAAICIMVAQLVAITVLFRLFTGPFGPIALVDAFFAFAIGAPLSLALGNYLSVLYPRAVDFSKVYGRSYSHISQFIMLLDLPLMAVIVGAGPALGLILDSRSVTYAIFGAETALAIVVYAATLGSAGRLMEGRAEDFLQSLVARK